MSDDGLDPSDGLEGDVELNEEDEEVAAALPDPEWEERLSKALEENIDYATLHELCQGHVHHIPASKRLDVWKVALGVSRKPDAMANWDGLLDCADREAISQHCSTQAETLDVSDEERKAVAADMQAVLTFFCKSRNARFRPDNGWAELLLPIAAQRPSRGDMYNLLYALTHKYIPRECRRDGRPFHLFRLLLLYHDPELCTFLDTRRVVADLYLQKWLRSLFVATCPLNVVLPLWDIYLLEADPFLVFFLGLVMLINAKEGLMEGTEATSTRAGLVEMISTFPGQLGRDDIDDFCALAQHYAERTPQSFRMDYHAPLFGPGKPTAMHGPLSQALCLPVGLTELLQSVRRSQDADDDSVGYFLVDCRPVEQFNSGHLLGAHHLNAELMLQNMTAFQELVTALVDEHAQQSDGSEHWCFICSGREREDQYANMVVAHFLQRNTAYVSIAQGGYIRIARDLSERARGLLKCRGDGEPQILVGADEDDGEAATSPVSTPTQSGSRVGSFMGRMVGAVRDRTADVRGRITQYMTAEGEEAPPERHVSNLDRPGRPYRDTEPVFSIDGDDEADEYASRTSESETEVAARRPTINVSTFCQRPEVTHAFKCSEMKPDGYMVPAILVITNRQLHVLRELPDRAGWAQLYSQHALTSIVKITSKKKYPELITLRFGTTEKILSSRRFLIPKAQNACKALKVAILKCLDA